VVFWITLAAFVAVVVMGLLFAYFGWWGGLTAYPLPSAQYVRRAFAGLEAQASRL
jgi:hypothetical protein